MNYPIMINESDLEMSGVVLDSAKDDLKLLNLTHRTFYEFIVLTSFRSHRLAVINAHVSELTEPIKEILIEIAQAIYEDGDFVALWNGRDKTDNGEYRITDLQERLISLVPPITWNAIFSLEPNIIWSGGEI